MKTLIGIFALDENQKVILLRPFSHDPVTAAASFSEDKPSEFDQIRSELSNKGIQDIVFDDRETENYVRQNLPKLAISHHFVKNQIEFNHFLTKVNSELTKLKIREAGTRDGLIAQVNNAVEELDKSLNIFIERLREFYSLHFPELDRQIDNHETFAKLVEKYGNRQNFEGHHRDLAGKSMGMEFNKEDVDVAKSLARNVTQFYELRKSLTEYLGKVLKEVAPNFSAIAGDLIAAKLIAKAGTLQRLSKMPSSTIQLLGSEKALFRFLKSKGKSKPPKYGIIYNHPMVQNAPEEKQGKIARLLASKLSIAARIDFYSKEFKAGEMKRELEEKVKEVLRE